MADHLGVRGLLVVGHSQEKGTTWMVNPSCAPKYRLEQEGPGHFLVGGA